MNLHNILPEHIKEVEEIVYSYLPQKESDPEYGIKGYQDTVIEAMDYSVKVGGKRLRPMIMLETYRMFGGKSRIVEPFMAALEMIHTYSLVHDDLPAMDNDTLRRGKPTTWAKYGDAMAVLTGDALLNFSTETALKAFDIALEENELSDMDCDELSEINSRIVRALKILTGTAGIYGMVGGQVADVEAEKKSIPLDEKRLMFIHENKTGALLQSAFMIGAILAGADDYDIRNISKAALDIGVAFQIQDDILDVVGDERELGKNIGSDAENGKETYVTLFGMDKAREDVKELTGEALNLISSLNGRNDFLTELVESLIDRNY